jgi:hypothetical protein
MPPSTGTTITRFIRIRISCQTMATPQSKQRSATVRHVRARLKAPLMLSIPTTQTMEGYSPSGTMQLVHDLLLSVEFWGLMCALVAILLLLLYILWLMRQRDQRLRITVDIVLQLTNSRNFARYHNLRVIKIHNDLVERLNDQYERELRENGDGPREIDSATLPALSFLAPSGPERRFSIPNSRPKRPTASSPKRQAASPRSRLPANLGLRGTRSSRLLARVQEEESSCRQRRRYDCPV